MSTISFREDDIIVFTYTNWKGETSVRKAIVKEFVFGHNEWHPENQLLLVGFDLDKMDYRTFAAKDISELKVIKH